MECTRIYQNQSTIECTRVYQNQNCSTEECTKVYKCENRVIKNYSTKSVLRYRYINILWEFFKDMKAIETIVMYTKSVIFYECKDKISIVIYEEDLRTFKPVN